MDLLQDFRLNLHLSPLSNVITHCPTLFTIGMAVVTRGQYPFVHLTFILTITVDNPHTLFYVCRCNGTQKCSVTASNVHFGGDPCPGTVKYLEIEYNCLDESAMLGKGLNACWHVGHDTQYQPQCMSTFARLLLVSSMKHVC